MAVQQRDIVLNEVSRYGVLCDKIQNNLAMGSDAVIALKKLNHKIGIKHHNRGSFRVIWKTFTNFFNQHKIIWSIVLWIGLVVILDRSLIFYHNLIGQHIYDDSITIWLPTLVLIVVLISSWKPAFIPMINLREDQKTPEYKQLENNINTQRHELNGFISQYSAFFNNAIISGFITEPNAITTPTPDTDGDFSYPYVSVELKMINEYMQKHQADTIHEASMLYTQQLAYENQVESNEQIIANTADAAEYSRQAANSARSAAANSAANLFNNIFRD